jgi:hypothetical protein
VGGRKHNRVRMYVNGHRWMQIYQKVPMELV